MSFTDKLIQIEQLQQAINKYGMLDGQVLKKITYKFRLEWNYHSNKIEGNSLTRMETRTVMIGNITINGKPIKDVYEMHQHDDIITNILKIGKGELNISEKRIKDIHGELMHEEDPEKKKHIGKWKTVPNYLFNYKNERCDFVAPQDVPEEMHKLINWLNSEKEKIERKDPKALHPAELAFEFHLRYVNIHPFYDGNGRTARIFMNLILISYGYSPLYVKVEERDVYNKYLADVQAYGGKPDLFYSFMGECLIRSQKMVLNAIEGNEMDEPDDLDKRLMVFEREVGYGKSDEEIKIRLTEEVFYKIFDGWISALIVATVPILQKFNKYFANVDHIIKVGRFPSQYTHFSNEGPGEVLSAVLANVKEADHLFKDRDIDINILAAYNQFSREGRKNFSGEYLLEIKIRSFKYEIYINEYLDGAVVKTLLFENLLHKPLGEAEINFIANKFGETILNDMELKAKGIRQK